MVEINKNELIAEFMGIEKYSEIKYKFPHYIDGNKNPYTKFGDFFEWAQMYHDSNGGGFVLHISDLLFTDSLDWLLPVIEKIEGTFDETHGYFGVHISSNCCTIQGTKLHLDKDNVYFDQVYRDTKIEATYDAVTNFIGWYKNNSPW
jgi:hypothetical protein